MKVRRLRSADYHTLQLPLGEPDHDADTAFYDVSIPNANTLFCLHSNST